MELNIVTLIFVFGIILGTQVGALFVQYRVNKNYNGIGYWLLGSALMALGYIFMPFVTVKTLQNIARIANPLLIAGHIFLYIGIKKFFDRTIDKWVIVVIFLVFNLSYYYYMYINNNISARAFVISLVIATVSFMITYELFFKKDRLLSGTANFIALLFFIYGCFYTFRSFMIIVFPQAYGYNDNGLIIIPTVILSIIISNLWTLGLIIMVNQRLNIDNESEKEKLKLIFDTNLDAQIITRLDDGLIVEVNEEFSRLSGYSKTEVIGSFAGESLFWSTPDDRTIFKAKLNDEGICQNMEFIFQCKDDSKFTGIISARIIKIKSVKHIISVVRDISERKEFENALIESEEKYRSILNASPDDITITDLQANILMISPAAKEIFGYDSDFDDFIGMPLLGFIIPADVERAKSNLLKMYQGATQNTNEYKAVRKDKSVFDVEVNSGFVYNANGLPDKMVFIIRDITKRKLIELQMQKLVKQLEIERNTAQLNSITDSLTGLFNRGYFDKTLRTEFSRLMRSGSVLSLIMLDIDRFKDFNDNYGHLAGDKCIRMIADMLKTNIYRKSDTVARYGGEEFILILPETDEKGARDLAERIRKSVEDLAIAHEISDINKYVTVSVGIITIFPHDSISTDKALKLVDDALYFAKEKGRNCCVYGSK